MTKTGKKGIGDVIFQIICLGSTLVVTVLMVGIFIVLVRRSWPAIAEFGLSFLTQERLNSPLLLDPVTGAPAPLYGTIASTAIALMISVPLAFFIAIFLTELAPVKVSAVIGSAVELLAAIPSIIYGMWGMFVFAPFMDRVLQPFLLGVFGWLPIFDTGFRGGLNLFTAGVILSFMILPFITSVTRDVFNMVPSIVKESAYGLGSTTWETTFKVTLPYSLSGVIGGIFLGLGRAIGETMAVAFVVGNRPEINMNLFAPGATIASTIANEMPEALPGLGEASLLELGLILFVITFCFQIVANIMVNRLALKGKAGV